MNVAFPFKTLPAFIADSTYARGFFHRITGYLLFTPEFQEDSYLIAHETAHAYWHIPIFPWRKTPQINGRGVLPFNWIFEGAATFMDHLVGASLVGASLDTVPTEPGCSLAETIGEIDQKAFNPDEYFLENLYASACNYTMGLGIFAALYRRLGEEEFRRGFGSLYLKISNLEHEDQCTGVETGICYVQKAFVDEASPGFAEAAGEVIDYWYYGTGAT